MGARIEVSADTVRTYLGKTMTRDNYHLFYGMHLLSSAQYEAVMDILINGDAQPEELVRLGGFTDAEADAFVAQTLSGWTSKTVAMPSVGTDGYAYLTQTLGLSAMAAALEVDASAFPDHRLLASRVKVGPGAYASIAEVEGIFRSRIVQEALVGLQMSDYIPPDVAACRDIPVPGQDDARRDYIGRIAASVYAPIIGPDDDTLLRRIIRVGNEPCSMRAAPGLAEWLVHAPHPSPNAKLFLNREAAVRSAVGEYDLTELTSMLVALEEETPSHVGTTRVLSLMEFQVSVIIAALTAHFPAETALMERVMVVSDCVAGLHIHRNRLRAFIARILAGCEKALIGIYPPA